MMQEEVSVWPFIVTSALVVLLLTYIQMLFASRARYPIIIAPRRCWAFVSGCLLVGAVIATPLAHWNKKMLTAHMIQHLILMNISAPLILYGEPFLLWVCSRQTNFSIDHEEEVIRYALRSKLTRALTHPVFCLLFGTMCLIVWHVPTVFAAAMYSEYWHSFEQLSFFVAGLCFWLPVIQPFPIVASWHPWAIPLYLFCATIPCDVLSAFLALCGRVVYLGYLTKTQQDWHSAMQDQQTAGALMWVFVTLAYLIPALFSIVEILSPENGRCQGARSRLTRNQRERLEVV